MAQETVTKYKLGWDIDDGIGIVEIKTVAGVKPQMRLPAAGFTAIAAILQHEKPVYYDTDQKILYTGPEPIGDLE